MNGILRARTGTGELARIADYAAEELYNFESLTVW